MDKIVVIAIGGNSLIKDKAHQTVQDQYKNVCETAKPIVNLIQKGYKVVITHGNGPQVGFALRRSEIAHKTEGLHSLPMVNCVASTQGSIGYQIQQAIYNEFRLRKMDNIATTVVTQVIVSKYDKSFKNPTKPIGSFYNKEQVVKLQQKNPDWVIIQDSGRGYRRVVPSPRPLKIVERDMIKNLVEKNFCVICTGGGGIPVIERENGTLQGIDAVIDKDFASSLLASNLKADIFLISTGVDKVCLNFNKPNQKELDKLTVKQAEDFLKEGHFGKGSMSPKIQACVDFVKRSGRRAIITSINSIEDSLQGKNGTIIEIE